MNDFSILHFFLIKSRNTINNNQIILNKIFI